MMNRMEERYLRYWWECRSKIDPQRTTEAYYRVFYDTRKRAVIVEKYGADHKLINTSKFTRRWDRLTRTESYDAEGNMKFYIIYRYGRQRTSRLLCHGGPAVLST